MADGRLKKAQEKKKQASSGCPSHESSRLKSSKNATPNPETSQSQPPPYNSTSSVPRPRPIHKGLSQLPTVPEIPGEDKLTQPEAHNMDVESATQAILGMASEMGDGASAVSDSSLDMSSAAMGNIGGRKDSPDGSEDEDENFDDKGM